jgi:hypothetical protein
MLPQPGFGRHVALLFGLHRRFDAQSVPSIFSFRLRTKLTLLFAGGLPRYTGGQTYYYPSFNAARSEDALKFAHEFGTVIADPICLEAVMRVRASRGASRLPLVSSSCAHAFPSQASA